MEKCIDLAKWWHACGMRAVVVVGLLVGMTVSIPARLFAEPIYVIDTPLRQDVAEVREEPTAFGQTIETGTYETSFATTEEVLNRAAGAHVRSIGGLGSYATISLRGASANQCLVLVDGLRLNSTTGGGVDLSKIPLSGVERIEITRGSDSAMYGESALGGVVNIITRDPSAEPYGSASSTWGGYGTREYRLEAGGPVYGNLGGALSLTRRRADNDFEFVNMRGTELDPRDDYDDQRRHNAFDDLALTARLSAGGDNWKVRATADHYQADKELPGTIAFPTPAAEQEIDKDIGALRGEVSLGEHLRLDADLGQVEQEDTYRDPQSLTSPLSITETGTRQAGCGATYTWRFLEVAPRFVYLEEVLDDLQVGSKRRLTRSWLARTRLYHDPLTLHVTLRRDDNSSFNAQRTSRAGLSWMLNDWLTFKANTGDGYRLPSFYELFYSRGFFVGNQSLRPERSVSQDLGFDLAGERVGLQINAFIHRYDDLIVYLLQSGYYYKPYNISRARARGCELYAWVEPLAGVRLSGNYTFNKIVDDTGEPNRDGNQIPGKPRNLANVQLDLTHQIRRVRLGVYGSWSYTEGNFLTRANTKKLDSRRIFNAGINLGLYDHVNLNVEVKNLFDDQVADLRGFPLEGRTTYVTLRMEL